MKIFGIVILLLCFFVSADEDKVYIESEGFFILSKNNGERVKAFYLYKMMSYTEQDILLDHVRTDLLETSDRNYHFLEEILQKKRKSSEVLYVLISPETNFLEILPPYHHQEGKNLIFEVKNGESQEKEFFSFQIYEVSENEDKESKYLSVHGRLLQLFPRSPVEILIRQEEEREKEKTQEVPEEITRETLFQATPKSNLGNSHYPISFVYSDWEKEVVEKYGKMFIARYNEHLYRDLPPIKEVLGEVPENKILKSLIAQNKSRALDLVKEALQNDPQRAQWSIIAQCSSFSSEDLTDLLIDIAMNDPSPTDRAWAIKEIAKKDTPEVRETLKHCLFDISFSIRLMAGELLSQKEKIANGILFVPYSPKNPFQYYFLEEALHRILPQATVREFTQSPYTEKVQKISHQDPYLLENLCALARSRSKNPIAAMVLYLNGNPEEKSQAFHVLEGVLLEQGKYPDLYHSLEFWLRCDIIHTWQYTSPEQVQKLYDSFRNHLQTYSSEKNLLLITLAYSFEAFTNHNLVKELASIREIKTNNYDLYCGACMALAAKEDKEAFPSLIHLLSLRKEPFVQVAIDVLERLTGLETPGRPRDLGVIHNLGAPKASWNADKAYQHWKDWYSKNKENLVYQEGKFVVK